jgi:hypothetical protein
MEHEQKATGFTVMCARSNMERTDKSMSDCTSRTISLKIVDVINKNVEKGANCSLQHYLKTK